MNASLSSSVYLDEHLEKYAKEFIRWKASHELAKQIMARPMSWTEKEVLDWIQSNKAISNQIFLGIKIRSDAGIETILGLARLMFIDWISGTAELGIYLGDKESHGKGYGEGSLRRLIELGFDQKGLNRIFLRVLEKNHAAIRLYEKMGFQKEGLLREHFLVDGNRENALVMGLLKKEYRRE